MGLLNQRRVPPAPSRFPLLNQRRVPPAPSRFPLLSQHRERTNPGSRTAGAKRRVCGFATTTKARGTAIASRAPPSTPCSRASSSTLVCRNSASRVASTTATPQARAPERVAARIAAGMQSRKLLENKLDYSQEQGQLAGPGL